LPVKAKLNSTGKKDVFVVLRRVAFLLKTGVDRKDVDSAVESSGADWEVESKDDWSKDEMRVWKFSMGWLLRELRFH